MNEENNVYKIVEDNIVIRFEPSIYAFSTNTIPRYLKVGDTFRGVDNRISEWEALIRARLSSQDVQLTKEYSHSAKINESLYFRDYSVHDYLKSIGKKSLCQLDRELLQYYSKEFFHDTSVEDVQSAIDSILKDANSDNPIKTYKYYRVIDRNNNDFHYNNDKEWTLRPNQKKVVDNYLSKTDKNELLMYAVMRFGKSFTAMNCALQSDCKKVLIVSAKADVMSEWKKTVEMPTCFKEYSFVCDEDLKRDKTIVEYLADKPRIAIFLTLQNLSGKSTDGKNIKERLNQIYETEFDLIIIDETHYGAWSDSYGAPIKSSADEDKKYIEDDIKEFSSFLDKTEKLIFKKKLHLSGTPYNLLYDEKFDESNIIATCQFKDILNEKLEWENSHFEKIESGEINPETNLPYQEFDNPYFGFPKMLRFAFNLPQETRTVLQNADGKWSLNDLFATTHSDDVVNFTHESQVLQLLKIIDGSEDSNEILSFLNVPKIKDNDVCKHIVMVLPYKYCCDAMEQLLLREKESFVNLGDYKVLNITGHTLKSELNDIDKVKKRIEESESHGEKTITLTVQKMLTGVTVKEWDTMIMLKNTKSAQEYDQAVFRIQNQYVVERENEDGDIIKIDMKPQTILVDFDPMRMFELQGLPTRVLNEVKSDSVHLEQSISEELRFFPIITYNADKLVKVEPNNIVEIITKYNKERGIMDEVSTVKLHETLLEDEDIKRFIESQVKAGLTNKLTTDGHTGQNSGFDTSGFNNNDDEGGNEEPDDREGDDSQTHDSQSNQGNKEDDLQKKYRMCIAGLSFFAFLSNSNIESLRDILVSICEEGAEKERNKRIFNNLHLSKTFIEKHIEVCPRYVSLLINDKIRKANMLSKDKELSKEERVLNALSRFNRISDSEIVTPQDICNQMINSIGVDEILKIVNNGGKILNIAGKTGEFEFALYNMLKNKTAHEKIKSAIYTIPTSSVTYEFTRYIFEILDLDLNNLSNFFTSYDLLTIKKDDNKTLDCERIKSIITQPKPFNTININDTVTEGDENVKFDLIIGNPPYQDEKRSNSPRDLPIYDKFMSVAYELADRVMLITPARFLFNAGFTPDEWNRKMLNDEHLKVVFFEAKSQNVFSNTQIPGGVAITYRDSTVVFGRIGEFAPYPELFSIMKKCKSDKVMTDLISSRDLFHYSDLFFESFPEKREINNNNNVVNSNAFEKFEDVFTEKPTRDDDICFLGRYHNKRQNRYILKEYIEFNPYILQCKVVFAQTNGGAGTITEEKAAAVMGKPAVYYEMSGFTDSFICVGLGEDKVAADNCAKYIRTKFMRALLATLKRTGSITKDKWANVPVQDFTNNSDIDWSKSIPEIDIQLYSKYDLSPNEIAFIESKVKPME